MKETSATFTVAERMKSRGAMATYEIPSWLLSEGTRRLTAIFALLVHPRRPSLLVIEEIENGLDPWTLAIVFQHLRAASQSGVQVVLTTHSPYLLDHVEPDDVLVVERVAGHTRFRRAKRAAAGEGERGCLAHGCDVPRRLPRRARSRSQVTRVALYVEGAIVAQPRRESPLERLWRALAARVCAAPDVEVVGISKGHIEHLKFDPPAAGARAKLPTNVIGIDQLIRDRHATNALVNVVIAFDCKPAINAPDLAGAGRCAEIEWLLRRLIARGVLPEPFLGAARRLQRWYADHPTTPRPAGRPPRLALEVLFMDPCFDALFAVDPGDCPHRHRARSVSPGIGQRSTRAPRRRSGRSSTRPPNLPQGRRPRASRGHLPPARHEWGHRFVTNAGGNARLLTHPIATRLGTLLV